MILTVSPVTQLDSSGGRNLYKLIAVAMVFLFEDQNIEISSKIEMCQRLEFFTASQPAALQILMLFNLALCIMRGIIWILGHQMA